MSFSRIETLVFLTFEIKKKGHSSLVRKFSQWLVDFSPKLFIQLFSPPKKYTEEFLVVLKVEILSVKKDRMDQVTVESTYFWNNPCKDFTSLDCYRTLIRLKDIPHYLFYITVIIRDLFLSPTPDRYLSIFIPEIRLRVSTDRKSLYFLN